MLKKYIDNKLKDVHKMLFTREKMEDMERKISGLELERGRMGEKTAATNEHVLFMRKNFDILTMKAKQFELLVAKPMKLIQTVKEELLGVIE